MLFPLDKINTPILLIRRWSVSERGILISNLALLSPTLVHVHEMKLSAESNYCLEGYDSRETPRLLAPHSTQVNSHHCNGCQSSPVSTEVSGYTVISHSLWDLLRRGHQKSTLHVTVLVPQQHDASYGSQKLHETLQI